MLIDIFKFFAEPVRGVLYSCNPYTGLYVDATECNVALCQLPA